MADPILWYFADPMCSWCWGFAPVIEQVRESFRERTRIALVLGGLRPGTTEPLTPQGREEVLHHWHQVHELTGQDFRFDGALPEGFVYDTEPPCRAVACMAEVNPALIFPMLKAAQAAFYRDGRDITRAGVLADLAAELGADRETFRAAFESDAARHRVQEHFRKTREWGVKGFPALVLQAERNFQLITSGWQPLERVSAAVEGALHTLS